jgi:hypothetical protein
LESNPPVNSWHTVVCVASGPSFTEEQAKLICAARDAQRCRVIAINDNYRRVPNADIVYACDGLWWDKHMGAVRKTVGTDCLLITADSFGAAFHGVLYVELKANEPGLSKKPGVVHGNNGGYQAINLACQLGARRIVLVGYDMKKDGDKTHWFGEHGEGLWNYHPEHMLAGWAKTFGKLAEDLLTAGVVCINCTLDTALTCFPKSTLEQEL